MPVVASAMDENMMLAIVLLLGVRDGDGGGGGGGATTVASINHGLVGPADSCESASFSGKRNVSKTQY